MAVAKRLHDRAFIKKAGRFFRPAFSFFDPLRYP